MRSAFAPLSLMFRSAPLALALAMAGLSGSVLAAPKADIQALAQKHQQPLLDTLRELVHIESGSKDMEGVEQIANYVAGKLREQGGKVEILQPTDVYRLGDTPRRSAPWCMPSSRAKAPAASC